MGFKLFSANMTFDLEASLDELKATGNERQLTMVGAASTPSRMVFKPECEVG